MTNVNNDLTEEEKRLRERLLRRRSERQEANESSLTNTSGHANKPNDGTVASAPETAAEPKHSSIAALKKSNSSNNDKSEKSPDTRTPRGSRNNAQSPSASRNNITNSKQQNSNGDSRYSSSAQARERSSMNRKPMNRREQPQNFQKRELERGGGDRYFQRPPPNGPPLRGRWERDRGGGGGSSSPRGGGRGYPSPPHRAGPPAPHLHHRRGGRGQYYDDYPDYGRGRHHDGPPRGRYPPHGHIRPSHPSPSHSSYSSDNGNDADYSYGNSYSPSRSRSRSFDNRKPNGDWKNVASHEEESHSTATPTSYAGSRSTGSRRRTRPSTVLGSPLWGRKRSRRDDMSSSSYSSSSASSSGSSSEDSSRERKGGRRRRQQEAESSFSKDQRTVFVSQLVMRTTERDLRRYFRKTVGCKVNDVILLRDKRSRNHKGCAYVQFGRIEDVATAVGVSGQAPDFQRFPILVKASEAEKNYSVPATSSVVTASITGKPSILEPFIDETGKQVESQKVYVGGLDPFVTEEHLFAVFSQFGQLYKVSLQMDPVTNTSRGYAFLSFRDPKVANLAIQTMAWQFMAGRPMKTGWANQASSIPGVPIVTSEEFPVDGAARAQKAFQVLVQLTGGPSEAALKAMAMSTTAKQALDQALGMSSHTVSVAGGNGSLTLPSSSHSSSSVPTVAEARASLRATVDAQKTAAAVAAVSAALTPVSTAALIGGADKPTRHILVYNMYDKDEETDPGWEKEIEQDFIEEVSKFGKIDKVSVMHLDPGGKIYASFQTTDVAKACAENLAGRWFDKRQLRVDFVTEEELPKTTQS